MDTQVVSDRITAILPTIRARREEIEQARRMPRDLVTEIGRTGVFRLAVARASGGDEGTPLELMEAIERIASADGSAGWCTMLGAGSNIASGYMDASAALEVFANPDQPCAGVAAPIGAAVREDGGVRVSGRWPFASGITHCEWVWAGCVVMEDGKPRMTPRGPEVVHVCLPVTDIQIHDTWFVSGLCGTGSNDFSATDVFVPARRVFALLDPGGHRPEPLYQFPPMSLFVYQLVSVALGIARAALDDLYDIAQKKTPSMRTVLLADTPVAQVELARAEGALNAARAAEYSTAEETWKGLLDGRQPTSRHLALGRIACTHAVETAAAVAHKANTLAGGVSMYTKSSLQRHARDADAVTHHFTVAPNTWEDAGRVLLGRAPVAPVF